MSRSQLESWEKLKPEIGRRQQQVLDLLDKHPQGLALFEIAQLLNLPINSVSGRVTELCARKLLIDSGRTRWNEYTRRNVTVWQRCTPQKDQNEFGF